MANNDQVSQMAEMIENLHSTSKSELYSEANVAGKGIGCIASKEIKKGSLVLRESPQLLIPEQDSPTFEGAVQHAEEIIKVFKGMSQEDQESYLKLHNKFDDDDRTTWSERLKREFEGKMLVISELTVSRMSKEKALAVWGIYSTNGFHNGVCIKMSRFNHSCRPNAQYFWNDDTNTRDLRSLRRIKQGEEITVSYIHSMVESREKRRSDLRHRYNFVCQCEGCDLTEEQALEESKSIVAYKEEELKQEKFKDAAIMSFNVGLPGRAQALMKEEALCLKRMYKLAKDIKTFGRRTILYDIVEESFDVSCQGAKSEEKYRNREDVKAAWMKDAMMFATIGSEIAKTLNGADHSWTQRWNERVTDPIKCFLKKHNL